MSQENFSQTSPNPEHSNVIDVHPQNILDQKDHLHLIDVRTPEEYTGELGHVAGATLITLDQLPQRLNEVPKDKTVIFICRSGKRSGNACAFAKENGFQNVYNMLGGMIAWNEQKFPTEDQN